MRRFDKAREIIMTIMVTLTVLGVGLAVASIAGETIRQYRFISKPTGVRVVIPESSVSNQDHDKSFSSGHGYYIRRNERREGK